MHLGLRPLLITLLDLQNSSYPTQPHSIIVYCCLNYVFNVLVGLRAGSGSTSIDGVAMTRKLACFDLC